MTGTSRARPASPLPAAERYIVELGAPGEPSASLKAAIEKAGGSVEVQGIRALGVRGADSDIQDNLDSMGFYSADAGVSIVADGAHSAVRRRLMPEAYQKLYPWGCIWATAPDNVGLGAAGPAPDEMGG